MSVFSDSSGEDEHFLLHNKNLAATAFVPDTPHQVSGSSSGSQDYNARWRNWKGSLAQQRPGGGKL